MNELLKNGMLWERSYPGFVPQAVPCGGALRCYSRALLKGVIMRVGLAAALLLAMTISSQPAHAGAPYFGFPFYFGDYPYYYGDYPPEPLIVPYGYYGYRDGCSRQPVWRRHHWHSVIICRSRRPR